MLTQICCFTVDFSRDVMMSAVVLIGRPDPSRIFINIGLGHHLEFSLPEALVYLDGRISSLNSVADQLAADASKIKAHIKLVLEVTGSCFLSPSGLVLPTRHLPYGRKL